MVDDEEMIDDYEDYGQKIESEGHYHRVLVNYPSRLEHGGELLFQHHRHTSIPAYQRRRRIFHCFSYIVNNTSNLKNSPDFNDGF